MPYERIVAYTLVDITSSGTVHVRDSNKLTYHQMQNLNVLLQTIGLRAQPINPQIKQLDAQDLSKYEFGDEYTGEHTVWKLIFEHEHPLVWSDGTDDLAVLKTDANGVAITTDLADTAEFNINVFDTLIDINLYFRNED